MDVTRRPPSQEYLLQGSVLDESVKVLLHKLKGMCDHSEDGLLNFRDHEIVYSMKEATNTTVNLRVRKQLDVQDQPYSLYYIGQPELGGDRPTIVRTCVEVNCTHNVCAFLHELGFQVDYEFIAQGWTFRKNKLRARVAKIHKILNPNNLDQVTPMTKSHFIEVSTISSSSNEQAAKDVHMFAEQLKPLVNLDKIDPRRLIH